MLAILKSHGEQILLQLTDGGNVLEGVGGWIRRGMHLLYVQCISVSNWMWGPGLGLVHWAWDPASYVYTVPVWLWEEKRKKKPLSIWGNGSAQGFPPNSHIIQTRRRRNLLSHSPDPGEHYRRFSPPDVCFSALAPFRRYVYAKLSMLVAWRSAATRVSVRPTIYIYTSVCTEYATRLHMLALGTRVAEYFITLSHAKTQCWVGFLYIYSLYKQLINRTREI